MSEAMTRGGTYEMIMRSPKNAVSSLLYTMAIFKGDPSGSPNKTCMAMISNQNYTI